MPNAPNRARNGHEMTAMPREQLPLGNTALAACSLLERVTGIEPALSPWESAPSGHVAWPDLRDRLSASDRERPLVTGVNGPLLARRLGHAER